MIVMIKAQKVVLSLFQRDNLLNKTDCIEYIQSFSDDQYISPTVDVGLSHSKYNIEKHKKRTYILYNTLFNSMITLSDTEYQQYKNIEFTDLSIIENLVDNGFLIPSKVNEYERYCYYKDVLINLRNSANHYTIALTSKCNARCIYCYEGGISKQDMSYEVADRFSKILLNSEKDIDINWFGGEPLLKTDIISRISDFLKANNKSFVSSIITNGSLLTDEIIKNKFPEWNVQWVQITIDGMKEEYLKRKCYSGCKDDIFETVLKNIDLIVKQNIQLSVRLNIDQNNIEECFKVAKFFSEKYQNNKCLRVYPAFLYSCKDSLSMDCDRKHCSYEIYKIYKPDFSTLSSYPVISSCYFNQQGAFVIDTDGSILACDGDVGKQKTKFSDIFSIENFDNLEKPLEIIPKVREMCSSCCYYPKCGGGCANTYGNSCEYDACFMERYEIEFLIDQLIDS